MKPINKIISATLALGLLFTLPACTDQEVSATLGAVAIGAAVGAAIASPATCHGGYRTECSDFRDHWGTWRRDCRQVYDSCLEVYDLKVNIPGLSEAATTQPQVTSLKEKQTIAAAQSFKLSFDKADLLMQNLEKAKSGDWQAVSAMGLSRADLTSISQFEMITDEGLDNLSSYLDQNRDDTKDMVKLIVKNAKADAQNVKGAIWTACMKLGEWKTPQNAHCEKTFWSGCSPETGATMCVGL